MAGTVSNYKKKPTGITYEQIIREVQAGNVKPIYYLMGDESYYIDRIADFIINSLLKPEEKDFNLVTYYGAEADIDVIITSARAFPMGAQRLVIVVKEAQNLKHIDHLEYYFKQVQPSTVLIFCHKNGVLDRRTKVATMIGKEGVLFESKRLYESQLPAFIRDYLKRRRLAAAPGAAEMMAEYVGADLNRLASELDKLALALPEGEKIVTTDLVQRNIGITKNYNIFELQDALIHKDVLKANRIVKYFDNSPKENPIQRVLSMLFSFYSSLMLAYYSPDKSERGMAAWLNMTDWKVRRSIMPALMNYTGMKVMNILAEIRRTDARSKGSEGSHTSSGDLMKELIYFILH